MSETVDFDALYKHGRLYSGFDDEDEKTLQAEGAKLLPHLQAVTDQFYAALGQIPDAKPFLEGRIDSLKKTHVAWLQTVFSGPYDANFAARMHKVGEVHVQVRLPVEFMACGMIQIGRYLIPILAQVYAGDTATLARMMKAINSVTGLCLIIMPGSYQSSLLAQELEKFMSITGISRALFNNLAAAYRD